MGKKDKPFSVRQPGLPGRGSGLPCSSGFFSEMPTSPENIDSPVSNGGERCEHCGEVLEERALTTPIGWGEADFKGQVCPKGCDLRIKRGLLNY